MAQRYTIPVGKTSSNANSAQNLSQDSNSPTVAGSDGSSASVLPKVVRANSNRSVVKVIDLQQDSEDLDSIHSSAATDIRAEYSEVPSVENGLAASDAGSHQDALEAQMSRMKVQQPTPPAATAPAPASAPAGAAAGIPAAVGGSGAAAGGAAVAGPAAGGAAVGGAAAGGAASPNMCGVGIRFAETTSGEFKITQLVPDSPAAACPALAVGDVIVKVDGNALQGKTVQEVIGMIVGQQGTEVKITVLSQCGYPHVMTAPFQALPFDLKKDKKKKRSHGAEGFLAVWGGAGQFHDSNLYGGGTLPPGFEHLESLRSAKPYTNPSLSIRTVSLIRQVFSPETAAAAAATAAAAGGASPQGAPSPSAAASRGKGVHPAGRIIGL